MLCVHEIFRSIQGEGPFMGRPAVFLRLAGCVKPYCSFCDTPEALEGGKPMTVDAVFAEMLSQTCSLAVITGGEPFLQWENGLCELEKRLFLRGMEIQYESSGRAGIPPDVSGTIVLSPKPGAWPDSETLAGAACLKVLWEENRSREILREIENSGFPAEKIWLMALGASREEQLLRMPLLWEICSAHGYQFSPRLHILAFDRRKGV